MRTHTLLVCIASLLFFTACTTNSDTDMEATTRMDDVPTAEMNTTLQARITSVLDAQRPDVDIEIEAEQSGRVTIEGTVTSEDDKEAIEELIESVPGVTRVRNRLAVQAAN